VGLTRPILVCLTPVKAVVHVDVVLGIVNRMAPTTLNFITDMLAKIVHRNHVPSAINGELLIILFFMCGSDAHGNTSITYRGG
jgi:hypothetical protein